MEMTRRFKIAERRRLSLSGGSLEGRVSLRYAAAVPAAPAYRFTVENSVYLAPQFIAAHRHAMLLRLIAECEARATAR